MDVEASIDVLVEKLGSLIAEKKCCGVVVPWLHCKTLPEQGISAYLRRRIAHVLSL
jgi:hypothetical protein